MIGPLINLEGEENLHRLVSVGHGSMGTVTSHLAATLIAATLTRQFEPLDDRLLADVGPEHFSQLDYLLLTHGHFDHVGAAREVADRLDVPFCLNEADAETFGL